MPAYYNEFDPFAAAWLRELMKAGHIPAGDVDERSIVDVRPGDLAGYDQCHFFAGIGGWSRALRLAGWPDDRPVWTGSPPCQPFSVAGKGLGKSDERHLAPVWLDLVRECRPANLFGEQVADAIRVGWLDDLFDALEGCGYACGAGVLPACGIGAPHIRKRLFFGAVGVADAVRDEWHGCRAGEAGDEPGEIERPAGLRYARGMADMHGDGRDQGRPGIATAGDDGAIGDGAACGVADSDRAGFGERRGGRRSSIATPCR